MSKLTTDRHEASRSLFATVDLLVSYPLAFDAPVTAVPLQYCNPIWCGKTRMVGPLDGVKTLRICITV